MIKKYINLAQALDEKALQFWCNSNGDLFNPHDDCECKEADLPAKLRNLYKNYWNDAFYVASYLVEFHDEPALVLNYLFDCCYIEDLMQKTTQYVITSPDMERAWCAVHDLANLLVDRLSECTVFAGEYTDPAGHEISILVPYRRRNMLEEIDKDLEEFIYPTFEELF